jgi:MFS family permease
VSRSREWYPDRTLAALMAVGIANHVLLSGARVAVSLDALARGASAALVGLLMALFALLPMLLAIHAGRLADRAGVRRPMLWGTAGGIAAMLLPAVWPGLPALFAASLLAGVSFMLFQVPAQRAVGDLGEADERAANYSWYALGFSVSGFAGPLIAGFAIDHLGFRAAFALLAVLPALALAALARRLVRLPAPRAHDEEARPTGMFDLLRHPVLRRLFALNALFALGWDLHTVFIPIYGTRIGLAASEIGAILAAFAAATFVVRLAVPWFGAGWAPMGVLRVALFVAAAVYLALPFTASTLALAALSFVLGLGLGIGQPVVMSQLHEHAPPGRVGETVGLRMSLIQTMAVSVPLVFGALGTTVGLVPVFASVGVFLGLGGIAARRR